MANAPGSRVPQAAVRVTPVIRKMLSTCYEKDFAAGRTWWTHSAEPIFHESQPSMSKSLPVSDGSSFLLCEDVREEVNNKLSIIGVFRNDLIIVQQDILVPSLMAVLFARGGEGPCETRVSLTDPKGQTVIESPEQTVVLDKNDVHLAAVRVLAPHLIVGRYTIDFFFDDVPIQRSFEVKTA